MTNRVFCPWTYICNNGLVHIQLLPADDYLEKTFAGIADIVCELRDKGVKPSEMAILVRANAFIPLIADYFTKHLPDGTQAKPAQSHDRAW